MGSYTRPLDGPEEDGCPIKCAECGCRYLWPRDIVRQSDGFYRCIVGPHCADPNNLQDEARARASVKYRDNTRTMPPGAQAPQTEIE